MEAFERLVARLLDAPPTVNAPQALVGDARSETAATAALNAAFLVGLCGARHPAAERAAAILRSPPATASAELAAFYRTALDAVRSEAAALSDQPRLRARLEDALAHVIDASGGPALAEGAWRIFFPEGVGILGHEEQRVAELRARRTVRLTELNRRPISDVAQQVLFTSNVLLTTPAAATDIDQLPYPADFRAELRTAAGEPQLRWYDHPIQIGVEPAANELLYGLRGLNEAAAFERRRGNLSRPLRVALSVSVTHERLRDVAPDYVRHELERAGGFDNLDVHVFTELDTARLIDEVLLPAGAGLDEVGLRTVFGVDGEYGRHYSFLKAIAALWSVLVEPDVRATFKIDLDQVFPQETLVAETGHSAFEHLLTPLWGARGVDSWGEPVELGMIAGALVNERDIGRGLFTPDVDLPAGPGAPDELVFFSRLPQAVSTRAEMMTRYGGPPLDGRQACLERIHVTGGTNGILVDALRHHRPFTPTFFGRAEDQAYSLSVLDDGVGAPAPEPRLTYAHAAGLIMRHDKEAFAAQAIEAARVGKLVGDDVRILYFSAYAELLGRERVKALGDPFTGCFISSLPRTVVLLRFALRLAHAFDRGDERLVGELAEMSVTRIARALDFTAHGGPLADELAVERRGWDTFYDALDELESGLARGGAQAQQLRQAAQRIIAETRVSHRAA
jgi:hypothetical protein